MRFSQERRLGQQPAQILRGRVLRAERHDQCVARGVGERVPLGHQHDVRVDRAVAEPAPDEARAGVQVVLQDQCALRAHRSIIHERVAGELALDKFLVFANLTC